MLKYVLIVFVLIGCGNVEIRYHYNTPPETLEAMAGYPVYGYTTWDETVIRDNILYGHCDIYLIDENILSEECWSALIQHEIKHCYEHNFHPNVPEDGIIPECMRKKEK